MTSPILAAHSKLLAVFAASAIMALEQVASGWPQTSLLVFGQIAVAIITSWGLFKVAQLKHHINRRMDELLELTRKSAKAEGVIEGRDKERANVAAVSKGIHDSQTPP